jgi:sigma-B regulation protein RsbU (phosphoserine phosphatase)
MVRSLARRSLSWTPALALIVVLVVDFLLPAGQSVASVTIIAPLLSSSLLGPVPTSVYGTAALTEWAVLATDDGQFASNATRAASLVRGVALLLGCAIAIGAAIVRQRRERRMKRIERVAMVAQRAILVPVPDTLGQLRLAARYESSAQDATVGGDFYDAACTQFGTRVLLGDVRGKGLEAVRLTADVLGAFRERANETADLAELLGRLSDAVVRSAAPGDFVTALLMEVDPCGRLTVVTAGHPPPILVRNELARFLDVPITRPPLGFGGRARAVRHQLQADDKLVLYTDGATEARRAGDREFFDDDRLLLAAAPGGVKDTIDRVFADLAVWTDNRLNDDVAILALQYCPVAATTFPSTTLPASVAAVLPAAAGSPRGV